MSVPTEADNLLERARKSLTDCISDLLKVIDPSTSGSNDFVPAFKIKLEDSALELMRINRNINLYL